MVRKAAKTRMKTYRAGNLNKPAGFTLLELVVVMLIVATMLGLVLPGTSWFFMRSDLKTSSRRLAGVVAETRSQAMLERRVQELTMDLDNGVFWTSAAGDSDKSDFEPTRKHALARLKRAVELCGGIWPRNPKVRSQVDDRSS